MSLIAREQIVYKDNEDPVELPLKKEEKDGEWPKERGEDIRLPPPKPRRGQEDTALDW